MLVQRQIDFAEGITKFVKQGAKGDGGVLHVAIGSVFGNAMCGGVGRRPMLNLSAITRSLKR